MIIRGTIKKKLQLKILEISLISLNKLIEGGAAILTLTSKNHHILIEGAILIKPLFNNILRLLERLNIKPAIKKRPEEHSP